MLANRLAAMKSARFLWSSADIPFEKLYDKAICRFLFNSLVFSYLVFWFLCSFKHLTTAGVFAGSHLAIRHQHYSDT